MHPTDLTDMTSEELDEDIGMRDVLLLGTPSSICSGFLFNSYQSREIGELALLEMTPRVNETKSNSPDSLRSLVR
jgi:hypothetical protein